MFRLFQPAGIGDCYVEGTSRIEVLVVPAFHSERFVQLTGAAAVHAVWRQAPCADELFLLN
jgi:hypothetical protein